MTHQFNGRGFTQNVEQAFKTPFEGRSDQRHFLVSSLLAKRNVRRARRSNRAI